MHRISFAAAGFAIMASGAFAAGDKEAVTISAVIAEYIDVSLDDDGIITYDPVNAATGYNSAAVAGASEGFKVTSNISFNLSVVFPTFQPTAVENWQSGVLPPTFRQAQFTNSGGDYIGGGLYIDTIPTDTPSGLTGLVSQTATGTLEILGEPAGVHDYALGAVILPQFSSTGAIPAPGTYSLDAVITATTTP